jgi:osmotically-inducible protein OsmY
MKCWGYVEITDGKMTLEGRAHSWPEKEAVLGAVEHAPGVQNVIVHLTIEPYF